VAGRVEGERRHVITGRWRQEWRGEVNVTIDREKKAAAVEKRTEFAGQPAISTIVFVVLVREVKDKAR
jgi:hypothetical protein